MRAPKLLGDPVAARIDRQGGPNYCTGLVLIAQRTFSSAEEFAYDLKSLKRATLIGETTGGGAHARAPHRIDDHFFIEVPFGTFMNPVTKRNREGTGVVPAVKVPPAQALAVAERLARQARARRGPQRSGGR
ncbi:MAG: S41 family peptidase [Steroidobacteraceae bacterium]